MNPALARRPARFVSWRNPQRVVSLLQFFLNHRVFTRSRRAERVGKTPRQLLTGQAQAHWLELLGFQRLGQA